MVARIREQLQRARARQVALLEMVRTLAGNLDEGSVAELAVRSASELLAAPYARLRLREPDGSLRCVAAAGLVSPETIGRRLPANSVSGMALERGLLNLSDASTHPVWNSKVDWLDGRTRAYLGAALRRAEQPLGVLEVMRGTRRSFSPADEQVLLGLANAAAVAVDNARLYRAAREELAARQQAEERFQRLAEATFEAVVIYEGSVIREANAACASLFGYAPAELIGASVVDLAAPESRDDVQQRVWAGWPEPYAAIGLRKDGTRFNWELRARSVSYQGRAARVVAIRDVTEQVEQAARRELLLQENARLFDAAQHAIRLRDQVLAGVAHDLRAPLTTIRLRAELLREQALQATPLPAERLAQELSQIEARAMQMARLLAELLDVARVQLDQELALDRRPMDLVGLVGQAAAEYEALGDPPLQLTVGEDAVFGCWDAGRLERVLTNLLGNARAYSTASAAVRLSVSLERTPDARWAVVRVQDSGLGIPAVDLPHIGEPFYRATNVRGRIGGTGLGLAGCRRIVEQHGGTLQVESEEGVGTIITVRLPVDPPQAD